MRVAGRKWIEDTIKKTTQQEPIYEFGAFRVPEQDTLANLRPLFPGKQYIGYDQLPGPGVDKIENIENLSLPDNTAGTIICIDTLEHVKNPHAAMKELFRVLRPGGLIIISSVFCFPIHNYPSDYWRFTPEAFKLLLEPFENKQVFYDGQELLPTGIYGYATKPGGTKTK